MPPRTVPPFRADHVGSLLRTRPLKEARVRREKGGISSSELKAIEDREIAAVIKKQEEIGLRAVTDGEFRRAFWNYDFLGALRGVEAYLGERKIKFQGVNPKPMMLRRYDGILPRPRRDLSACGARFFRCGLSLPAVRRSQFHLSMRPEAAGAGDRSRGGSAKAADDLCGHDQCRDVRYPIRDDHRHASVPRQLPVDLRCVGRL